MNKGMKGLALLLVLLTGLLPVTTGCTAKSSIVSTEEEELSVVSEKDAPFDPEKDSLLRPKKTEEVETAVPEQDQPVTLSEAEAKGLALSAAMRTAEQNGQEVDQTSVKVMDQDSDDFYISVDFISGGRSSGEESDGWNGAGTEIYRVSKSGGEVSSIDGTEIPEVAELPEKENDPSQDIVEEEGY